MAIKVKQSTIDEIKKMGMTKALASAKTRRSPEFQEALKRMYGQRRLDAAMKGSQGGSMPKATYMYKGTSPSGATKKRKQMTSRNTPGAPAGTGARQVASRKKSGGRAGAIAGGVASGAAAVAGGIYAKGKMEQKKIASMTGKQKAAYLKERAEKVKRRGAPILKAAKSPAGKAVGKAARFVARRNPLGLALTSVPASPLKVAAQKAAKGKTKGRGKSKK